MDVYLTTRGALGIYQDVKVNRIQGTFVGVIEKEKIYLFIFSKSIELKIRQFKILYTNYTI